jgi:hypothetical protein
VGSQWERLQSAIFVDYEDVQSWLAGRGPVPDVHRVNDMIGLRDALQLQCDDETFTSVLADVVRRCILRRCAERAEEQPPANDSEQKDWMKRFFDNDPAARVWLYNAAMLKAWAKREPDDSFSYLDEEGEWWDLKQDIPVLPECGIYCPRRVWDVVWKGEALPDGELEPRAAAEIRAFARLIEFLPGDEARMVKLFLCQRLQWSPAFPEEFLPQIATAFAKMYDQATEEERELLFPRDFLPGVAELQR